MKKHLLMLFAVMMAATMSLKAQTIVIDEGFENGIQDSVWTQEYVVGNHPWAVESIEDSVQWPASIWQGSKRAYLRNTSGETEGYVTRLVSKVMDLRPEVVYQPELTFWYANPKWTKDRDTLRVLYRTSQNTKWKQLAEYSKASANWQKVKLELPEVNGTYQIAFEGTDNLGRGIVLDSIKLRSAPECTVPHDIAVTSKGAGLVNIAWIASWDALEYELIVSKNQINPDTVDLIPDSTGIIAFHENVSGLTQNKDVQLVSGEYYYVYLRSICETETSAWNNEDPNQGQYRFRVKASKNIPYSFGFDMPYEPGILRRDLEWTWGGNTGKFNPFVNVAVAAADLGNYSKSATTCVVFSGTNVSEPKEVDAIPANKYAYLATPALADTANANFSLSQCQVRFWTTVYNFQSRKYARSLIVGIMTDPEDITTFVPVDTISMWGYTTFQENVVDFSGYNGVGNYVAFMSNFDLPNVIFLDDITIEYKKEAQVPTEISVNPRDNSATITWKGFASSYNVVITNEEVNPDKAELGQIVDRANGLTATSYTTEALEADHSWNRPYYVYVQAVDADSANSAWSYRYPFVTIASKKEAPYTIDFEKVSGKTYTIGDNATEYPTEIGIFSNDPEYPHLSASNYYTGKSCINLVKDWGNDSWITLPMVDSLMNLQVKFYMRPSSDPSEAHATFGVMTNPMDINTFIPVSDFKLTTNAYTLCYANFANYSGPEDVVPAIIWADVDGNKQTKIYIDDVTIEKIDKCLPPVNIQIEAQSDSMTVSWDKSLATTWELIVTTGSLTDKQLNDTAITLDSIRNMAGVIFADTVTWSDPLANPTFGFDSLIYNTPYNIYARTMCGEEATWWVSAAVKTPCPDNFPIPFYEDFESYETGDYSAGFACWQVADYATGTGYPKILKPSSGAQDGNMLELWSTSTTHRNVAMLPGIDADMKKVVLSFDARSYGTTTKSVLYVGSMGDIADWTSFVAIDTIYMDGGNEFTSVRLDLANYTLAYNNIAFSSGLGETLEMNSDIYIDNISLKPNTCIEAWNVETTEVETNLIGIKWDGKSNNDEWTVKVMQDTLVIVADTTVTGKAFRYDGFEPMTEYTFYIQPNCDTIWTSATFRTSCVKLDPNKPNKENFDGIETGTSYNANYQIQCWTSGNGVANASTSYLPYVYKSATYASSGTNTYRVNESSSYAPAYVASPEIDCEHMKDLAVTFNVYSSTSYYFVFGVMSDPTDLSTFVAIDSVKGTGKSVQFTYDLSEYADSIPATAKYCCWRGRYAAADLFYLDDVSIMKINCPLPKPSYSGLTAEQVRISSGLRTDNDWILLAVDTAAFTADQLALLNVDSLVNNDSTWQAHVVYYDTIDVRAKVVTGLKEQTDYYVAVATVCEEGISQWSIISFKTPCLPVTPEAMGTITFSTDEGYVTGSGATRYLPCWTTGNLSGNAGPTSSYIPYVYTTASYLHNKNNCLYFYSYVPTSATSTKYGGAYAIMPELNVEDISKYQVNFWARTTSSTGANYNYNFIIGVVTDPSDLNTFVAVDTIVLSATYEPFTISLEDYQGDYLGNKGKYIMFLADSGDKVYCYAYLSEVSVTKIPTCRNVTAFTVDSVAGDAAMISWKQYSDSYRMMVAKEEVADSVKTTYKWLIDTVVVKTDSVMITGLEASTQYFVYAQALCEGGDSSDISMAYAGFTTLCPADGFKVPYKQDFERYATNAKVVDCWDFEDYATATKTYPEVMNPTTGAVSGKQLELWSSSTTHRCVAIMPKIQGNLADYMLSFDARSYGVSTKSVLYIGTMDDVLDSAAGFAPFDTLYMDGGNEFYHKDLVLADYASKLIHSRIAFSSGLAETLELASDMYLDNVRIGMPPSCFAPAIEAGSTTIYSAEVAITPAKEGNNKWQIAVVPDSVYSAAGYDAEKYLANDSLVRIVEVDTVLATIDSLAPGTMYWLYARTVCGGEDGNSEWTNFPIKTRTKYYYADSYFFGFEKSEGWERSPLSTSDSYIIHPAIEVGYVQLGSAITSYSYLPYAYVTTSANYNYGYGPADGSMGISGLRWNATASYYGQYVILPALNEAKDRSFEFKFRNGYSYISSGKYIVTTSYDVCVEVGTVDKFKGMETYQKLATISRPALPSNTEATEANDWQWWSYTMDLDSATIADKQLVFYQAQKPKESNYPYFDHVKMDAPKGYGMVSLEKVQADATAATVTWDNLGGPWSLYILKANGDTLKRYENIVGVTSQEVTGLTPQTKYTAVLVAANAPADTKYKVSSSKDFTTPCLPINPNHNGEFVWDFNDASEWDRSDVLVGNNTVTDSAYWKPGCFTTGTTYTGKQSTTSVYYNWLIQRKGYSYTGAPTTKGTTATSTARYEYGRDDSPALRVYTSSTYMTPYIVMPALNCSYDTMMIEFWGRCFCNYAADYGTAASQNKMVSATYLGASYSKSLVVGTLTNPSDFSTLEVIDTVTYNAYTSTTAGFVTDDQSGNRYWQQFQLPLAGAKGKYIVLFQPAYGLFFLDDLAVKPVGDNLFAPSGAQTSNVTESSATFSWIAKHPTIQSVVVVLDQDGETEILRDTVPGTQMTYTAKNLNPATAYQWYMYQTNGTVNTATTPYLPFYTECLAVTPDYKSGFELDEGWKLVPGATSDTYKQTLCWVYGNAGTTTAWSSSFPYNYANTTSYTYSYSGAYSGPRLYASGTTYQTYMAMPAIEDINAYDTLQINFMMRPGYHVPSTGKISTTYAYYSSNDHYYAKSVMVGTMTDPNDASTFVAIDTITYNGEFTTSDYATVANDYLFQKCKVALTGAQGKYVTIMASFYRKGDTQKCTYDYMWIDDVWFSAIQHCDAPVELSTTNVTATEATVSWEQMDGAAKYLLQVSTDPLYAEDSAFVFNDTLDVTSYIVTGLKSNTDYIWRVKTICTDDLGQSDFSQNSGFHTARTPFFVETFGAANLDADWSFATNPAALVIDSADVELTGTNSTSYGWRRVTTNAGIDGAHYAAVFYSSSSATTIDYDYYWMISPVISLNDSAKNAHLTFDIALTGCSASTTPSATPASEAQMADDYTFMVLLSEDGGKTWKKENILAIWNNTLPAGNQLRDIPFNPANIRFDLAKYAGKNIRVAFYREADTYKGSTPYTCAIHLDNIRVNYYDVVEDNAQACQYEDIDKLGFYIDGDIAEAGEQTLRRIEKAYDFDANTKGYRDSIYVLDVNYIGVTETILSDTICEGDTYTDVNFHGKERAGVYRRKMQSVEACDSLVTLYLYVTPRAYAEDELVSICPGETFTWHDKVYDRQGIYVDTTVSIAGCDSISTLVLSYYAAEDTIKAAIRVATDSLPYTYVNEQYPYAAGQKPIIIAEGTAVGQYTETAMVQGANCTAILILDVTVYDPHEGILNLDDENAGAQKVIIRGDMYIKTNKAWYNAAGQKVADPRK